MAIVLDFSVGFTGVSYLTVTIEFLKSFCLPENPDTWYNSENLNWRIGSDTMEFILRIFFFNCLSLMLGEYVVLLRSFLLFYQQVAALQPIKYRH